MLLHLPTGAGKTVIATLIIERMLQRLPPESQVLFVAHRKELVQQTADTLALQLPDVPVSIEQGRQFADHRARVIVASIQSLANRKSAYPVHRFALIICDECHRALAPRWLDMIRHFHDERSHEALLLGMTATPRRTDGRSAVAVFDTVAYAISRPELQDLGYLVPVEYWSIRAQLDLDQVKMSSGDFQVTSLASKMNVPAVRALTLRAWRDKGAGKKTLGFCASVAHAHQLCADFQAVGYRAAVIDGRTADRDALLAGFRAGGLDVLFNYGVLTEGFDDPSIECLLLARPTTSPLVYNQCLGRGLRLHPGKRACTVIDIIDRAKHQLQYGASQLAGLPQGWRSRGRDPFREARALQGVRVNDPDVFAALHSARSLEQVQNLLMSVPPECVVAGLDGEPVPYYEPVTPRAQSHGDRSSESAHEPDIEPDIRPVRAPAAGRIIRRLLGSAGAPVRAVATSERSPSANDNEGPCATVKLAAPHIYNEKYGYLLWHLQRATGWDVTLAPLPKSSRRTSNPRTVLRSMLAEGQRIVSFTHSDSSGHIIAEVSGIQASLVPQLERDFQRITGLALQLRGQLAFLL